MRLFGFGIRLFLKDGMIITGTEFILGMFANQVESAFCGGDKSHVE